MKKLILLFILLISISTNSFAVTRFYLPNLSTDSPAGSSPDVDSGWERISELTRAKCNITTGFSSSIGANTCSTQDGATDYDSVARQYVSDPIDAQTISGTVKGQILCLESNGLADFRRAIVIRVMSNDGLTVRGTLLSDYSTTATEFSSSASTNRFFPASGTAVSSVTSQSGDRIVIEIGIRKTGSSPSTRSATFLLGDNGGSDLPEDETSTTSVNPWIEFSHNVVFQPPSSITAGLMVVSSSE